MACMTFHKQFAKASMIGASYSAANRLTSLKRVSTCLSKFNRLKVNPICATIFVLFANSCLENMVTYL